MFSKFCKRCGRDFKPKAKYQKLCKNCIKESNKGVYARIYKN